MRWPCRRDPPPTKRQERAIRAAFARADEAADQADAEADAARAAAEDDQEK